MSVALPDASRIALIFAVSTGGQVNISTLGSVTMQSGIPVPASNGNFEITYDHFGHLVAQQFYGISSAGGTKFTVIEVRFKDR